MSDTLYKIVQEFETIMQLLDDITSPDGAPCQHCNPERLDREDYYAYRATVPEFDCKYCNNKGATFWEDDDAAAEAIAEALGNIEMDMEQKAENITRLIANWDGTIEMFKREETRLANKRKSYENRKTRLRRYLTDMMTKAGIKKIETNFRNVGWRQGNEVVHIDDESMIPDELVDTKVVVTPKKKDIKLLLKEDNQSVPGAHIERNDPFIVIK